MRCRWTFAAVVLMGMMAGATLYGQDQDERSSYFRALSKPERPEGRLPAFDRPSSLSDRWGTGVPLGKNVASGRTNLRTTTRSDLVDRNGNRLALPDVCVQGLPSDLTSNAAMSASVAEPAVSTASQSAQQWRDLLRRVVAGETESSSAPATDGATIPQARLANYLETAGQPGKMGSPVSYNPHPRASYQGGTPVAQNLWGDCDPHQELFSRSLFPSAVECGKCHEQIFEEWASSSHAYAAISPMFHRFEDTINRLSQGTLGYFCLRCHAPVATTVGLRRDQAIWDGPRVFREGVTCIACHHVQEVFVKSNGERRIEPGSLTAPVTGSSDGSGVEAAIKFKDHFKLKTDPDDPANGQLIHQRVFQFQEISASTFCVSCHQVAVQPGIKLEVVWDQYRASPACREGISCQDCHMGKVPGVAEGYSLGPAAVVDGRVINPLRKHANHAFYGPGYSIAHPGIFPHDPAQDRWTVDQWLEFDWRAGWGTDAFEDQIESLPVPYDFPPTWANIDDRYDAREVVAKNQRRLEYKTALRRQILENGSNIDGPYFEQKPGCGQPLEFHYCVINKSKGHNMPSGSLGAQPQLWLNVVLVDPLGCRIWESGYLDSRGDLADRHSRDVLARRIPLDKQLFNLQTKFLTTNVKGTDREMYLPINFDLDQLPFLRPATQPVSVMNHPPFIRMEGHSIPALGARKAHYRVPGELLSRPGTYRLTVRLRSRAEPIYFMEFVGATEEMIRSMNQGIVDTHTYTVTFDVP